MFPPVRTHWHHLANTIETVLSSAYPVHNPNGTSTGSAVFAQLAVESPYTFQWALLSPKLPLSMEIWTPSRHTEVIITRLRLGKCCLNAYLHQIGKYQNGLCQHCNKPETVTHFLTECCNDATCSAILADCKKTKSRTHCKRHTIR